MIAVEAIIEGVSTLAEGGLKLNVHTQELNEDGVAKLMKLSKKYVWAVFKEQPILEEEVPTESATFSDELTLDERFNKVLFAYHMAKTNDAKTFHSFKRDVYETLITRYKDKLSEIKSINQ